MEMEEKKLKLLSDEEKHWKKQEDFECTFNQTVRSENHLIHIIWSNLIFGLKKF